MLFSLQMTGGEEVQVPPARHGVGIEESAATFVSLLKPDTAGGEAKAVIGLGEGPRATMDQIKKAVTDGVREGRRKVILQADGNVPHGEVLRFAAAITEIEGITLHVGVQEPQ
jgi:biopolymer transport protein ExbD